jgi:CheY-like chemotaxis protein
MLKSLCMIDDNEVDIYQVSRVIEKSGSIDKFYSFADGKEALEHFLNFEESQKKFEGYFPPSAILLDINMPRMNGFQFLEEYSKLKEEKKVSLIVGMLTSSDNVKDMIRSMHFQKVTEFFQKPFTVEHLKAIEYLM